MKDGIKDNSGSLQALDDMLTDIASNTGNEFSNSDFESGGRALEDCKKIVKQNETAQTTVRSIHHFACSGGTLLSKCISAMPNTFLLSEVHPTTKLIKDSIPPEFRPTDIISLSRYAELPELSCLAEKLFKADIETITEHLESLGCTLVLREHSHSDYCVGETYSTVPILLKLFDSSYKHKKVATIRDPIDSFISLKKNDWCHFSPATFDEYCKRLLAFTSHFQDNEIIKYEDFVVAPMDTMKQISGILDINFVPNFEEYYEIFRVTGDSGRKGGAIAPRDRRALDTAMQKEIDNSVHYADFKARFKY